MATSATVTEYYQKIIQRDPTAPELSSKVAGIDSNSQTLVEFRDSLINSAEALQYVYPVARIYQAVFGREPDAAGFDVNVDALRGDLELVQLANAFVASQEFLNRFGTRDVTDEYIEALYQNVLGRASDAAGKAGWLASGQSAAQILIGFSESAEFQNSYNPIVVNFLQAAASGAKDAPGGDLDFTDDDGKIGISTIELLTENNGEFIPATAESSDLINLNAFRSTPAFQGIDGSGQTVVVIDTGIDLNHAAFGPDANGDGISDRIIYSHDFSSDGDGTADDFRGHGSNVASIVASSAAGYTGMAPGANIIALQVIANTGGTSYGIVEKALQWVVHNAAAYNIASVNMSIGDGANVDSEAPNPNGLDDELAALGNLGVIVATSAGNDYYDYQVQGVGGFSPDPNTIAVGAVWDADVGKISFNGPEDFTTGADRLTSFSQRSENIPTILAPGGLITGAAPGGGTEAMAGTSQAAPHIAGIAALAQQLAQQTIGRRLTPQEFESLLLQSGDTVFDGDDEDDNVTNSNTNYTRVDVLDLGNAILALGGGTTPIPVTDSIPGDVTSTSTLTIGQDFQSRIDFLFDVDYVRVSLTVGQSYTFDVLGLPSSVGALSDPTLTLRDADNWLLAFDDDSGNGRESQLTYTPMTSGTYYLEVEAYLNQRGSYILRGSTTDRDQTEVQGDSSTGSSILVGQSISGTLDFDRDTDWHRATFTAGTTYRVDLKGAPSGSGTIFDPLVRVYSASGVLQDSNDDGGTRRESLLLYTPAASGTYYISAESFRTSDQGTYALSLAATASTSSDIAGDSSTTASISAGGSATSTLDPTGDTDWFAFAATAGSEYVIDLGGVGGGALLDPLVRIMTASGTEIASNDDGGTGLAAQLIYAATTAGTVYISAESFANSAGSGDYQLSVTQTCTGSSDIPGDASTTVSLTTNTPVENSLEITGDSDWFRFDVSAGTQYTISLEGIGANELSDPLVRVFSASGTQLDSNDDGGTEGDSLLNYTPTTSGTIYIEAASFNGLYTGDYRVLVSVSGVSSADATTIEALA